jgi:hypothetical protein
MPEPITSVTEALKWLTLLVERGEEMSFHLSAERTAGIGIVAGQAKESDWASGWTAEGNTFVWKPNSTVPVFLFQTGRDVPTLIEPGEPMARKESDILKLTQDSLVARSLVPAMVKGARDILKEAELAYGTYGENWADWSSAGKTFKRMLLIHANAYRPAMIELGWVLK